MPTTSRRFTGIGCGVFVALLLSCATPAPAKRAAQAAPPDSASVVAMLAGVANASCPMPGVATGGQIDASHVRRLARSKFRTVLDLRTEAEPRGFAEAEAVRRAGLDYVSIPVSYERLDDALFRRIRTFMNDDARHPVMVHCASGNRVGVVLVPWLVLDRGWTLADAVAAAEMGGMRAGPSRDSALDYLARHGAKR